MRALIVEDDNIMRKYIIFLLKQFKCEIAAEATTGEEAIYLAEQSQPDCIFMDIVLDGEMNGIEAAKAISEKKSIPIIFISGYDLEYKVEELSLPNMLGYFFKPVDEHSIRIAVKKILNYCVVNK